MTSYPYLVTGQTIVATHEPPRITLNEDRSLPMSPVLLHPQPTRLTGVWWFKNERKADKNALPDMFRRGNVIVRVCFNREA